MLPPTVVDHKLTKLFLLRRCIRPQVSITPLYARGYNKLPASRIEGDVQQRKPVPARIDFYTTS